MTSTLMADIKATLEKTNNAAINDHHSHLRLVDQLEPIHVLGEVGENVVRLVDSKYKSKYDYVSYNQLYIGADGMVHISRISLGVYRINNKSLEETIEKHNETILVESCRITNITRL